MLRAAKLLLVFLIACGGRATANQPGLSTETEFTVRLPAAAFLDSLDDRERREQMRDWGVLATLAHEGATPEQTAAATYQMPPARLPYLDELYRFAYGRGRRAYLGERVLLFVDEDDPDRTATIGRLADQVRMELGEVPRTAEVYVVDDRRNTGTLHVTRSAIVEGARLFSPEYGYITGEAANADQLAAWLSQADDLSQVRIEPGKLVLGGRRFAASRTTGVTLDDVATLYQATRRVRDRQADVTREWDDLETKYEAKLWRRMNAEGYYEDRHYTGFEYENAKRAQRRIAADLRPAALAEAQALSRAHGPTQPGFSLVPRWLPGPDSAHPLMLARLQQLANDPCGEISRIAGLAPKLLEAEPDASLRSGEAWAAAEVATSTHTASTCTWLRDLVENKLRPVLNSLAVAPPTEWNEDFGQYYRFAKDLEASRTQLTADQAHAVGDVRSVLRFYEFETGALCARYDETAGTAVGMTLFYTDLLAKLWHSVDYGWSAPVRAIPGFLASPRVNVSPAFQEELDRLPSTHIWFGPRTDSLTRKADRSDTEFAFAHRFSRVYAAGSDPAEPSKETTPNEVSRLSIDWWNRHFDEIADYEPQFHRQNQIMKWSAVVAAMYESKEAPMFLEGVAVDRSARFFPWLAAHRDQLRLQEPVPQRPAPNATECIPLFQSYPFLSAGNVRTITGGVNLAGRRLVKAAPTINMKLPRGQRVAAEAETEAEALPLQKLDGRRVSIVNEGAAAEAEALPLQKLDGRRVSIVNEGAARVRASSGPMNLSRVEADFEGQAGAPKITVNSQAGKIATVAIEPIEGGVRINLRPELVEHVLEAFDVADRRTVISFEGQPAQLMRSGDALVEMTHVERASTDTPGIAIGRDALTGDLEQARAIEPSEVFKRMDAHEWQIVKPSRGAFEPPRVQFRNEPPPAGAREIPVRGVHGVTMVHVTEDGELYFARPSEPEARAGWRGLSERVEIDPAFRAPVHDALELSASSQAKLSRPTADQFARSGRLEDAAATYEGTMPAKPATFEDRVRLTLYNIGTRNPAAAKLELDALTARGLEISPETRSLLVDSLRNHGEADVAELVDATLQGQPTPAPLPLIVDRGRITVVYETRSLETVDVTALPDDDIPPSIKYFDQRLLVGREGFEPDFSGSIARWLHDPELTVREMKVAPFDVAPGVIKNPTTGQQFLRARDPDAEQFGNLPAFQPVYVIEPHLSANPRCDHASPDDAQSCTASPDDAQSCTASPDDAQSCTASPDDAQSCTQ